MVSCIVHTCINVRTIEMHAIPGNSSLSYGKKRSSHFVCLFGVVVMRGWLIRRSELVDRFPRKYGNDVQGDVT
ncbi:unnamed protein product [Periconia digitata]|uniref:Uncharacterized protein n=1 Tax=Periconia digitata TaxID=1303443 RepID=A0A9W4UJ18_9PLEO|nr:unnamed protein product [Periconia digitata]